MDYSTISNKTNCTEMEELTNGELSERYYLLKKQFDALSQTCESTKQELYDTRRSYQTALDVQSHLTADLESLQAEQSKKKNDLNHRISTLVEEISQLREERTEILDRHAAEVKKLEDQIQSLKEEQAFKARESPVRVDNSELDEIKVALNNALEEAAEAKACFEQIKMELSAYKMKNMELVSEMKEVQLSSDMRREDMRAACEREATALAELAEAKAMLNRYTNAQELEPHAAKGNSIFAEVEDKRQEMAKNLIQMKQSNSRLRRELANKQAELDALLHEKQTIWETQVTSAAHYDRVLIECYEARITELEECCERQRRELARWFGKHCEPSAKGWLPGVLDHFKSECEHLRAEVLSRGAAQLASAAQIRDLRRKLALTAAPAPTTVISPPKLDDEDGSTNTPTPPVLVRKNVDDVKKKVQFN